VQLCWTGQLKSETKALRENALKKSSREEGVRREFAGLLKGSTRGGSLKPQPINRKKVHKSIKTYISKGKRRKR